MVKSMMRFEPNKTKKPSNLMRRNAFYSEEISSRESFQKEL